MKKIAVLLLLIVLITQQGCKTPDSFSVDAKISVAPEIRDSFLKGGRLILHLTLQKGKEPRTRSEITFGTNAGNWDPSKTFVLQSQDKNVMKLLPGNLNQILNGKIYYQIVYKQNPDDGQENVPGNLFSGVDSMDASASLKLQLTLSKVIPGFQINENKFVRTISIQSKLLTEFWGRPMFLRASVLLPSGYYEKPEGNHPICYKVPGLNGRYNAVNRLMDDKNFSEWWFSGEAPQIIYVFLDSQGPYGDTYQMDSENNGPCGKALTEELIPEIEKQVRYNPVSEKRYLAGCSTGGWVTLGLQVFYPDFFNGTWSFSPDPVDFEHYGLINIYQDSSVFYNRYGYLQPGRRTIYGEPTYSMKEWIANENIVSRTGDYRISGGQFGAYNAVFGPRGKDGLPTLMFDPVTGRIDHQIAEKWEKYDIKKILEKNWTTLGPKLQGKIFIWTGDMDGLYSNVATRFLKMFIDKTENPVSDAKISFTPMAGHCQEWNDKAVLKMIWEKASGKLK